jgi:hypothetical protein
VVAPDPVRNACQASPSAGKRSRSGFSNVRLPISCKVEAFGRAVDAVGIREAMCDRDAHVVRAEVRDHRAVTEFDHAMNDRLRVHQHLNLVRRQIEKVISLNHFKAFVHQRRRIDRDLRTHRPIRMLQRGLQRRLADECRPSTRCGTARRRR